MNPTANVLRDAFRAIADAFGLKLIKKHNIIWLGTNVNNNRKISYIRRIDGHVGEDMWMWFNLSNTNYCNWMLSNLMKGGLLYPGPAEKPVGTVPSFLSVSELTMKLKLACV